MGETALDRRASTAPPAPVAAAVWLMWAGLALGVVAVGVLSADDVANAYGSNTDDDLGGLGRVLFALGGVAVLVAAALWAALAVCVRRGRMWARVTTWVVSIAGVAVLLGFGLTPSATGFVLGATVVLAAVCVLLALPAATAYFRTAT
jgi:uncharacterized membrane protein YhaH (DUF805 family)